jgi:hypothetical protein
MTHRINCAQVELEVDDVALATALLERISQLHERRLAPVIDRVCSEVSEDGRLVRIDTLELELGSVSAEDFDEQFVERLERSLRSALREALFARAEGPSHIEATLQLLETFAWTGNLPWSADVRAANPVTAALALLVREAPRALLGLLRELAGEPTALTRVLSHADRAMLLRLGHDEWEWPAVVREVIDRVIVKLEHRERLASGVDALEEDVAVLGSPDDVRGSPQVDEPSDDAVSEDAAAVDILVEPSSTKNPLAPPSIVSEDLEPSQSSEEFMTTSEGSAELLDSPVAAPASAPASTPASSSSQQQAIPPPARERPTPSHLARRRASEQLEELYVEDAGLVILWPFLARFFSRVELVDEDRQFVDEPARMQAIALIEQLAFGDPDPPEYLLPLAKLLCGLAPTDIFELARPLTPAQVHEGERLLAAVIDHAPILHAMTIPRFRVGFLQRPGALCIHDGGWLLRVERRTHDIVLERFPWGWAWVKLPWMTDPLRVEW